MTVTVIVFFHAVIAAANESGLSNVEEISAHDIMQSKHPIIGG